MKIIHKTLQLTIAHDVVIGDGSIKGTIEHYCFLYENRNGEIDLDIDFADIQDITFLGTPIESGYKGYQKFKKGMLELGIDVGKMFDEAAAQLITDEDVENLKQMYSNMLNYSTQTKLNFAGPR
jgi:hypothetical protein